MDKQSYCTPEKDDDDYGKMKCWSCRKLWSENPQVFCPLKGLEF